MEEGQLGGMKSEAGTTLMTALCTALFVGHYLEAEEETPL